LVNETTQHPRKWTSVSPCQQQAAGRAAAVATVGPRGVGVGGGGDDVVHEVGAEGFGGGGGGAGGGSRGGAGEAEAVGEQAARVGRRGDQRAERQGLALLRFSASCEHFLRDTLCALGGLVGDKSGSG